MPSLHDNRVAFQVPDIYVGEATTTKQKESILYCERNLQRNGHTVDLQSVQMRHLHPGKWSIAMDVDQSDFDLMIGQQIDMIIVKEGGVDWLEDERSRIEFGFALLLFHLPVTIGKRVSVVVDVQDIAVRPLAVLQDKVKMGKVGLFPVQCRITELRECSAFRQLLGRCLQREYERVLEQIQFVYLMVDIQPTVGDRVVTHSSTVVGRATWRSE